MPLSFLSDIHMHTQNIGDVPHRSSGSQAGAPQSFEFFCHFCGQSLKVSASILLITYPMNFKSKYLICYTRCTILCQY